MTGAERFDAFRLALAALCREHGVVMVHEPDELVLHEWGLIPDLWHVSGFPDPADPLGYLGLSNHYLKDQQPPMEGQA